MDYRGLALIVSGVALSVLGFQQSATWGWGNPATVLCIVAGVVLLVAFAMVERTTASPLIEVAIFRIRAFAVENLVLGIAMLAFVPVFFFASEYAQIALGKTAQQAGLYLLYFFLGFVVTSQIGGRILDRRGAKRPVVLGCAAGRRGVRLVGQQGHPAQLLVADVARHPGGRRHGVHAHPGQYRRRQPGVAALLRRGHRHHPDGPELRGQPRLRHPGHDPRHPAAFAGHDRRSSARGVPPASARAAGGPDRPGPDIDGRGAQHSALHPARLRLRSRTVFYIMAGIMAVAALVALVGLQQGRQEDSDADAVEAVPEPG